MMARPARFWEAPRWTAEEDAAVRRIIALPRVKRDKALLKLSRELGRTHGAVRTRSWKLRQSR